MKLLAVCAAGCWLSGLVTAEEARARIFADTCVERESDDVAGNIIRITGNASRPVVMFQWSEGALMEPVPVVARFNRDDRRLAFTVKTTAGRFAFTGRLTPHRLEGLLTEPWQPRRHVVLRERSPRLADNPVDTCR